MTTPKIFRAPRSAITLDMSAPHGRNKEAHYPTLTRLYSAAYCVGWPIYAQLIPITASLSPLPHYTFPSAFIRPHSTDILLFKAAVVFGFLGMFRYSSFAKLTASSIVPVTVSGRELALRSGKYSELTTYARQYDISGFYFRLTSKFHPHARAYYCSLSELPVPWSIFCPVQILVELSRHQLLCQGQIFPSKKVSAHALSLYMNYVANSTASFSPHSQRIGGHTFYSVHNMHEDFVHYLGRRKINRPSQVYYRARATDNILRLSQFFKQASTTSALAGGGLYKN